MGGGYAEVCRPIAPFSISLWFSNHRSETSQGSQIPKPKTQFQFFKNPRNPGSCWEFVPEEKEKVDKRKRIYIYIILNT
jgi:hypothetical protein